jgi:tRNA dimethylallyltransferase
VSQGFAASASRLGDLPCGFLIGPTASGKSRLALAIADQTGAEIISLDSMQVYRGMDVGTAKPSSEDRARARHHMLDLVDPNERFDIRRYLEELGPVLAGLRARAARALFVGGTGFYLKALLSGLFEGPPVDLELRARIELRVREVGNAQLHAELSRSDPRSAARIHANDTKRLVRAIEILEQTGRALSDWQREWGWHGEPGLPGSQRDLPIVGLDAPGTRLDRRIAIRTAAMLAAGWPDEAARIRSTCGFGPTSMQALGYPEALALHDGTMGAASCAAVIAQKTRRFARKQRTWYRKFEGVLWLEPFSESSADDQPLVAAAVRALNR